MFSCCVDIVASEHYNADSLIHYGHSCLSQIEKLPVLYVFEKYNLDLEKLKREIDVISNKIDCNEFTEKKILVVYDVAYYHLYGKSFEKAFIKIFELIKNYLRFI